VQSRDWLTLELAKLGFTTLPSKANFVFTTHTTRAASELLGALRERKILVRHFKQARIANHLRISVGTQAECEQLIDALQHIVSHSTQKEATA
jgi:histidinol-phosphate aminotransferase